MDGGNKNLELSLLILYQGHLSTSTLRRYKSILINRLISLIAFLLNDLIKELLSLQPIVTIDSSIDPTSLWD